MVRTPKPSPTKIADAPKLDTKPATLGIVSQEPSVGTTQSIPTTLTNTETPKTNSWRKPKPTTPASDDGMEFG
jgi:hypothetical protein